MLKVQVCSPVTVLEYYEITKIPNYRYLFVLIISRLRLIGEFLDRQIRIAGMNTFHLTPQT